MKYKIEAIKSTGGVMIDGCPMHLYFATRLSDNCRISLHNAQSLESESSIDTEFEYHDRYIPIETIDRYKEYADPNDNQSAW